MKLRLTCLAIVPIVLLVAAAGCKGDGGGGVPGLGFHAPSLSGLSLYPASAKQNEGSGTVPVNFSVDFADADGDVTSMTITVSDSTGTVLDSGTVVLEGDPGITEGYIYGTIDADTSTAGNYTISFSVTDSLGLVSNRVTATFTVVPPLALVSLAVTPANPTIDPGAALQFTATGTYNDSSTLDLTSLATWTSSDEAVAAFDYPKGRVYAMNGGSTTITAGLDGISDSTVLTVESCFGPAVRYPGIQYRSLGNTAIGDLNGDGRNDVAVVEEFGSTVFLYYQKTNHTMDIVQTIDTDLYLRGIAIADVNQDGLAELILAGNGKIEVYNQDPVTHALTGPQSYTVCVTTAPGFVVADLNNDGLPDIAAAGTAADGSGAISILFQNANGTLASEATYTAIPGYAGWGAELHVADMNSDGLNDIVVQTGALQLAVIKQTAPGVFSTVPDYYAVQTNYWPDFESFALGDLNGDGRTDIIVSDLTGNMNLFLQNGTGQLTGPTIITGYSPEIHIADIDGDGRNDIILLDSGNLVTVLYQGQDHAFGVTKYYHLPTVSSGGTFVHQALSIGDVTGDGVADIVASWSDEGIFVLPGLP